MKTAAIESEPVVCPVLPRLLKSPLPFSSRMKAPQRPPHGTKTVRLFALLSTAGAIHLVRAYARIKDGNARHALIEIAEHLAGTNVQRAKKGRKG